MASYGRWDSWLAKFLNVIIKIATKASVHFGKSFVRLEYQIRGSLIWFNLNLSAACGAIRHYMKT